MAACWAKKLIMYGCKPSASCDCVEEEQGEVYHGEVGKTMTPRDFQNNIWSNEVVASVEHADIALPTTDVDELSMVSGS